MVKMPKFVTKLFWGDDLKSLSYSKHKRYISQSIMQKGNLKAAGWLLKKESKKMLKKNLSPKMDKKSLNFWKLYLG